MHFVNLIFKKCYRNKVYYYYYYYYKDEWQKGITVITVSSVFSEADR